MTVVLWSDKSIQNVTETALLNPYSAALHKNFDSEFQEEPLTALNDADPLLVNSNHSGTVQNSCSELLFQTFEL